MHKLNPYATSHPEAGDTNRRRTYRTLLCIVLGCQTLALVAAILMQRYSLSLPDSYTNVYSDIHTWLFIGSVATWLLCVAWCGILLGTGNGLPLLAWPWLACSCLYFGWVLLSILRFMAPIG